MERLTTINDMGVAVYKQPYQCERCGEDFWRLPDLGSGSPTDKLAAYEELEERINTVYGECNGLLEKVVEYFERHKGIDLPEPVIKARLLTDGEVDRWEEYKRLEEQGKLLIMAYEICVVSECIHCNHVERRIEEAWIRPELLGHEGFYKTREEAEAALKEIINQTEI